MVSGVRRMNEVNARRARLVPGWVTVYIRAGIPSRYVTSQLVQLSLASLRGRFGWCKGGNVTSAGWQVTLCDPMWHVSSPAAVWQPCKLLYTCYLLTPREAGSVDNNTHTHTV